MSTQAAHIEKVKVPIPSHILREMMRKVSEANPELSLDDLIRAAIFVGVPRLETLQPFQIVELLDQANLSKDRRK